MKFSEKSRTEQHMRISADINKKLSRYNVPRHNVAIYDDEPQNYADFSGYMLTISAIQNNFRRLPADIRKSFANDVANYVDLMARTDESSLRRTVELGLRDKAVLQQFEQPQPQPQPPAQPQQ